MTTLRQFTCDDLFRFNPVNLDPLTETYGVGFYLQYLARWPEYFLVAESPSNDLMGYIMGKSEGIYIRKYFNLKIIYLHMYRLPLLVFLKNHLIFKVPVKTGMAT